ncbi:hypothetical protein [Actinoallomurus sp. NPDC052274]|uniref:hypothetical protein n=1 Tax=Actinoallomurus sp. NPDC052274 TaxID=3155420 RepID=UPI003437B8E9
MVFVRAGNTDFTAIIPGQADPWEALFLRADRVAKINTEKLISDGRLVDAYDKQLAGIPESFAGHTDAAFDVRSATGTRRTIFILGDQCLDWQWGGMPRYQGPITEMPDFGRHIPSEYRSDLNAVMGLPDGSTMLFKGNQCAVIDWGPKGGCSYKGSLADMPKWQWRSVPPEMSGDFDHAVMFKSPDQSQEETLFIKGEQAMVFHWSHGPRLIGGYAAVAAGLDALPGFYHAKSGNLHHPPQRTPPLLPKSTLTTDWSTLATGAPLTLRYSTSSDKLSDKNWIGLYPAGPTRPPQESFVWAYTPDAKGSTTLDTGRLPGPGSYAAWYFYNDGYDPLAGPLVFTLT